MSLDTAIAYFRSREQTLMRSTCTVKREDPNGTGRYDPDTLRWVPQPTVIFTGACLIRPFAGHLGNDANQGEADDRVQRFVVKLPADTAVEEGDVVTIIADDFDPTMVDRVFRLIDVPQDGWQINRRCGAQEVIERGRPA